MKRIHGTLILIAFLSLPAWGGSSKGGDKPVEESKKTLDFDADVVEGMNRQPLDSLTQLSEGDGSGAGKHLYHRGKKFNEENRELARDLGGTY